MGRNGSGGHDGIPLAAGCDQQDQQQQGEQVKRVNTRKPGNNKSFKRLAGNSGFEIFLIYMADDESAHDEKQIDQDIYF